MPPETIRPEEAQKLLPEMKREVSKDGVWTPTPDPRLDRELEQVVAKGKDKGYNLHFVVYPDPVAKPTYYRDIATAVQKDVGGTVIVLGSTYSGTASSEFSRVQLEQAQDNMANGNPTVAANQYLDRMTEQTQTPWTAVTIVLILAVVLAAVVARKMGTRRSNGGAAASD